MTSFYIIAALLLSVVIVLLLFSLRGKQATEIDNRDINVELFEEKRSSLEQQLAEGGISKEEHETFILELERDLLSSVDETENKQSQNRTGSATGILISLFLIAFTFTVYQYLGTPDAINRITEPVATATPEQQTPNKLPPIEDMVVQLEAKMKQKPEDGEGWALLARTYTVMERFQEADTAYKKAVQFGGTHPDVLANYAENTAILNNYDLSGKPIELIDQALALDPDQPKALWLKGSAAFQQNNFVVAIETWRHLLSLIPPNSPDVQALEQYIEQALTLQSGGELQTEKLDSIASSTETEKVTISVNVNVRPDLLEKINPDDIIFVFARHAQGPRMPLAIARISREQLGQPVILDEDMAMTPQMSLANAKQIVIGARVSKSGDAIPKPGDFEGYTRTLEIANTKQVDVTINSIVE